MNNPIDQGQTLVGQAQTAASNCADDLEAAYLLHPAWQKIQGFRLRALSLRDDIAEWLAGQPGATK